MTGRSLVTRRAIVDIVRGAVLGSYGVTAIDAGPVERLLGRLGLREPGIRVRLDRGLEIDLHLTVASGVPVAEVARQVDSAVRYGIRRALDREVRRLAVHVGGLRYQPASVPPTKHAASDATANENASAGDATASVPDPSDAGAGAIAAGGPRPSDEMGARPATSDAAPDSSDGASGGGRNGTVRDVKGLGLADGPAEGRRPARRSRTGDVPPAGGDSG